MNTIFKISLSPKTHWEKNGLASVWEAPILEKYVPGFTSRKTILLLLCALTILLFKIPYFFHNTISEPIFYARYLPLIIFNGLILYSFATNKLFNIKYVYTYLKILVFLLVFISILPQKESPYIQMATFMIPLFLWFIWGAAYANFNFGNPYRIRNFIKLNITILLIGLLIMGCIFAIVGFTMSLLSYHKIYFLQYCFKDVIRSNAVVVPLIAFYLAQRYPRRWDQKIKNLMDILVPMAIITLMVFLFSIFFLKPHLGSGFLLAKLVAVGFLSLSFTLAGITYLSPKRTYSLPYVLLLVLSLISLFIIVLTIKILLTRIGMFTFHMPYRIGLLAAYILLLGNILWMIKKLYLVYTDKRGVFHLQKSMAMYFPIYAGALLVAMLVILPFVFFT